MPSSGHAGYARAAVSIRAIRCRRAQATEAPTRQAPLASRLRSLCFGYLIRDSPQLSLVEHRVVHHANQHLLNRSVTEPIDDALDRLGRNFPARLRRLI